MMYDDWLIQLTDAEWIHFVNEGEKSIATHRDPKELIRRLGGSSRILPDKGLKMGRTESLIRLKKSYGKTLHGIFKQVKRRRISEEQAVHALRRALNYYFKHAYALGLRVQGVGRDKTLKEVIKNFRYEDHYHVRTMIEEEARYLKGFIKTIQEGSFKMPYAKRLMLYVNGLDGIYNGARIAALESNSLLYWVGPSDKNKCASCTYLVEASPFIPSTLPTTPRAGDTLCLARCRDKIVARKGLDEEVRRVITGGLSKEEHLRNLKAIRENKMLRSKKQKIRPVSPHIPL